MTQKLYIPIGIPGSGKTTYWRERFDKEHVLRISRDDINTMLSEDVYTQNINNVIKDSEQVVLESAINAGFSVYIDRVNLTPNSRKRFINKALTINKKMYVVGLYFTPDLQEALKRNIDRPDKTTKQKDSLLEYIPEAFKLITAPTFEESIDEIIYIDSNGNTTSMETLREFNKSD